ncbi:hypothetical protein ATE80_16385 [Streptomyces kanasensis]|uniref:Uncharacterized protein n=1 Tax=Streptomyces kanasensis TaxID=936756 RepID=A0A117IVR2_9ACTN|nr:hypothetical protein ATE80_16385 [Streptomyces kanasensis]
MCQSSGCSAIPPAKASASAWVITAVFSARVPEAGTSTGGCTCPRIVDASSYQSVAGSSSAPVCWASSAGPAGIRARSPKKSTSTPDADRSRSATRHTSPPERSRRASAPKALPPVCGITSMPSDSRYATNRSYSDSGSSRSATVVNGTPSARVAHTPARSQLARCGSARTTPRPAARVSVRRSMSLMSTARRTCSSLHVGSRKDSIQYRMYERIPARESSARRCGVASGTTRARFASSRSTPLPRRLHAVSAMRRPSAVATGSGSLFTVLQPAPYRASVSRSLIALMTWPRSPSEYLRRRRPPRPRDGP